MLETPIIPSADYSKVYEPAEDSYLLLDLFEQIRCELSSKRYAHSVPLVVEIGTGSGVVTAFLNKNILPKALYLATDVNPHSCVIAARTNSHNATSYNMDVIRCDLTSPLLTEKVDILIFNPPYVPAEKVPEIPKDDKDPRWLDLALDGGPTGMDITQRVLDSLHTILALKGEAYILFCARNQPDKVVEDFKKKSPGKWDVTMEIRRKAGWEMLSVYKFVRLCE
ncbi:unnamed protein product [Kuraishia capsulata CBS 1993]|uniref:Methyltransferase small domain-containing protein n=1 Tax=Kuraishia capsulata CBS 1993 TaxID=1382522 RepID=W6MF86_9ASCO|nr:uncharacterized protein KUCA_T00000076001 [Kuraishia capsulata CBS 1993]CDK24116.1 unnamed protein product [Kuraishia capsulata CBS 1993]